MFKNLKQRIADGVEGVTPGRQTPLQQQQEATSRKNNSSPANGGATTPLSTSMIKTNNSTPSLKNDKQNDKDMVN